MGVEKIMTFKSGKFVFSDAFSLELVAPLEIETDLLLESLRELPILPDQAKSFEIELVHRSIFSTAAIEGNPLREQEVSDIINRNRVIATNQVKELEIINLSQAYQFVEKKTKSKEFQLSEKFIKEIHKIITSNISYDYCTPGHYRNHIVKVGDKAHGGVVTPPKCLRDIEKLMKKFVRWFQLIDSGNYSPILKAAIAHYHLARIHPFADGNGRVARLVETAILKKHGMRYLPEMLSHYYYREIDAYYIAFSECRKSKDNDITPFIAFVLKGAIDSLRQVKSYISVFLKQSALREYYAKLREEKTITQRQHEVLSMLLSLPVDTLITVQGVQRDFPFRVLYSKVSDRTARRDISKLKEIGLLLPVDGSFKLDREILNAL